MSRESAVLQTDDEIRLRIEPGGFVEVRGDADSKALRRQLATALAASVLLEGQLVLITDWLPGLHWRVRASQQFANLLPSVTVDAIWNVVEPHLTRWLDKPADAEVFVLSREWGNALWFRRCIDARRSKWRSRSDVIGPREPEAGLKASIANAEETTHYPTPT